MAHPPATAHGDAHHVAHGEHDHPKPKQYIQIAAILTAITIVEVALLYLPEMGVPVGGTFLVILFAILSIAKFLLVVGYFMHLKFDPLFFRWAFGFALLMALMIGTAFVALFHGMYPF